MRESVLQSLMRSATCAFQGTKLGGDYGPTEYFFRREQGQLTGVVWHSWDDHSRVEDVYCYLVRSGMPKGSGTALHAEFLKQMTARHTTLESLRCPMAICRLKAETWLKSLGYQNVLASSSRGARDGDHLVLQVREALSRAQQSAAKRPKLTPAPKHPSVEDRAIPLIPWVCACTVRNEPTAFRCATCDAVRTV